MNEEEITKLFFSDPDKLFEIIKQRGGDLESFKELEFGKLFVKKKFPELIKIEHEEAVDFVFWFTYYIERETRDDIIYIEKALGKPPGDVDLMVDEMTFGQKIAFIEKNYVRKDSNDNYIKILREVKELRNALAHGELDKLVYGGYSLSDPRGQLKLFAQFSNTISKRPLIK